MKPEIKELWINALKSGEYEQTTGVLCQTLGDGTTQWCCLGVLTDLAVKAGVQLDIKISNDPKNEGAVLFDGGCEKLPLKVQQWADLYTDLGHYTYEDLGYTDEYFDDYTDEEKRLASLNESTLAEDNDNGTPFADIARLIESYF